MDEELKKALEATRQAQADARKASDKAHEEIQKYGRVSAETIEKVEKLEAAVDAKLEAAQKRYDELERKLNREAALGGREGLNELEAAATAFNGQLAARFGGRRSALSVEQFQAYKKGFLAYMVGGPEAVMGRPELQAALSVGSDPSGGYVAPADLTGRIDSLIYESSDIRRLAGVRRTSRDEIEIHYDADQATSGGWVGELATRSTTGTPVVPQPRKIPLHEQYAFPLISQKTLDDADFDAEGWLARKVADILGRTENTAFVTGNGIMRPRGFTTYTAGTPAGGSAAAWAKVRQIATGAAGAFKANPDGPDVFIDMMGALKDEYLRDPSCSWAMTRTTLSVARKLKDSNGQYQVQLTPGLQGRPGFEILGFPIARWADLAEIGSQSLSMAFGAWAQAYQIADHTGGLRVLRDVYTQKPYVGFYSYKRTGGDVANFEALVLAKFHTS